MPPAITKKPEDHRRAIENAMRSVGVASDVRDIIIDNFNCACKAAHTAGYEDCAGQVLSMANSLSGYGKHD